MQILEIIRSLLNANKHAFAYANYKNATNYTNNQNKESNIMAFWQPSFDHNYPDWKRKSSETKNTEHEQKVEKDYPSEVIRKTRKLAKNIAKVAKETPKSLTHYLSKEDIENLGLLSQELTAALIEIKAAKLSENENSHEIH